MATQVVPAAQHGAVVQSKGNTLQSWLKSDHFKTAVAAALPKHLTPDRFVRVALNAFMRTPKLAECTQESVFRCMLDLSALGLEADGRRAHLIPFKRNVKTPGGWQSHMECQLIVDYKGLVELAYRSGTISNIHADRVCENDEFEYDRGILLKHRIDFRRPRGKAYAYYARVVFKDSTDIAEVMTTEEVNAIRARSKSKDDGPWVTDFDEMAKKTVFKRLSKWLTLSPEFRDALDKDDDGVIDIQPSRQAPEVAAISIESFAPSDDDNRGHDHAATEPTAPIEAPAAQDLGSASNLDPDATVTDERAEEVKEAMNAAGWTRKRVEKLWADLKVNNAYGLTNRQADLALATIAGKEKVEPA